MKQFIEVTNKFEGKTFINVNHIIVVMMRENETLLYVTELNPIVVLESYETVKNLISQAL